MKFIFLCLFIVSGYSANSQEAVLDAGDTVKKERSYYIKTFSDKFFIWPVLKQRRLDFEMKNVDGEKYTLQYKSNKPYSVGLGMYLFELGFELAFAVPLDQRSKYIYGESEARDVQLNILGKRWGIDLHRQKYSGFYINDPEVKVPVNSPYIQRPDIATRSTGIAVHYTFNHQRFSFRSAYNFIERQLSSSGSPIIIASLDRFSLQGDSAIVGDGYNASFGDDALIKNIRSTTLGMSPGYTYSLIYKGFFLNGMLAIGPANNFIKYSDEATEEERHNYNVTVSVAARLAIGYNGDKYFGGLTFINQGRNTKFEGAQLSSSHSSFKILFGFRFKEFGILKKRVWDLPKSFVN